MRSRLSACIGRGALGHKGVGMKHERAERRFHATDRTATPYA